MTVVEPPERPEDEPEGRVSRDGPNVPVGSESEERFERSDDRSEDDDEPETDTSWTEDEDDASA